MGGGTVVDGDCGGAMSVSVFRMHGVWVVRTSTKDLGSFDTLAEAMAIATDTSAGGYAEADRRSEDLKVV